MKITMPDGLEFDPVAHAYRLDGRPVPSVTQVLGDLLPQFRADQWYLDRGRAVHACAALLARGVEFAHDPQIDNQVSAIKAFLAAHPHKVLEVERPVCSRRLQYAGTLDLLMEDMILDYKSELTPTVPYQLAAYALAYEEETGLVVRHGRGVAIPAEGSFRLSDVYDLRRYKSEWLALLTTYRVRCRCGVQKDKTPA